MAAFDERLAAAKSATGDRRLRVSDIERRLGSCYSVDTVARLRQCFPRHRLVWIIGADNLPTLAEWRRWPALFQALPVAVVDRWPYSRYASVVKPAKRFARRRMAERRARGLVRCKPPAWIVIHGPLHPASCDSVARRQRHGEPIRGGWRNTITVPNQPVRSSRRSRAGPAPRRFTGPSPTRSPTPRRKTSSPSTSRARPRSPTSWSSPADDRNACRCGRGAAPETAQGRRHTGARDGRAARTRTGC